MRGPAMRGLSLSKGYSSDGLKKSNELLNEQVKRLQTQVNSLKLICESQEIELKNLAKEANDANKLASEESSKSKAAKEVIKTLTSKLKEMADKILVQNNTNGGLNQMDITCKEEDTNDININKKAVTGRIGDNGSRVQSFLTSSNEGNKEWIEQYEPGVYITLITFPDDTRDLKRVRFSRRRFGENQAYGMKIEKFFYEKYNVCAGIVFRLLLLFVPRPVLSTKLVPLN